jgi:hypothetical protein
MVAVRPVEGEEGGLEAQGEGVGDQAREVDVEERKGRGAGDKGRSASHDRARVKRQRRDESNGGRRAKDGCEAIVSAAFDGCCCCYEEAGQGYGV